MLRITKREDFYVRLSFALAKLHSSEQIIKHFLNQRQ